MNGGQAGEVEGAWSASLEWLVRRLAPRLRQFVFAEVRYRVSRGTEWLVSHYRFAKQPGGV